MNLMKLFNYKYFKENLKKSKGLLAFVFGVIPLLNIIILAILAINGANIIDFNTLSSLTIIGLYFIPLTLAVSLFGFVFKKKSVDFIMSKPLSRKSIYFTNIIGGILTLFIFILLNTLIFGLFSLFSNIVIPASLLFDYLLYFFIAYVFIFSVATLAISLAGNFITSMVIVLLIILLCPFFILSSEILEDNEHNYIKCPYDTCDTTNYTCINDSDCKYHLTNNEYRFTYSKLTNKPFTAPIRTFYLSDGSIYNNKTILKSFILSLIYLTLGFFAFKKRKMEHNETSFKNEFLLYLVKLLTLIPIGFLSYVILSREENIISFIIILVSLGIYSIIYDLITKKEIYKFLKSLSLCVLSVLVICVSYSIYADVKENKVEVISNIDSLKVDFYSNQGLEEVYITDKNTINKIISSNIARDTNLNSNNATIITSGNKSFRSSLNYNKTILEEALKENKLSYAHNFNYDSIDYITNFYVTKEIKKLIKEVMQDEENILSSAEDHLYIKAYSYDSHTYNSLEVPFTKNKNLFNLVSEYQNKTSISLLSTHDDCNIYISSGNLNEFNQTEVSLSSYILTNNKDDLIAFLKTENQTLNENPLILNIYYEEKISHLNIYNREKFKELFTSLAHRLENDAYYQELLKSLAKGEE